MREVTQARDSERVQSYRLFAKSDCSQFKCPCFYFWRFKLMGLCLFWGAEGGKRERKHPSGTPHDPTVVTVVKSPLS